MKALAEEDPDMAAIVAQRGDEPRLLPWVKWAWRAWFELSNDRVHHLSGFAAPMGGILLQAIPIGIPWTAIAAWAEVNEVEDDDFPALIHWLAAMDDEHRRHWNEQQKARKA